MAKGIRRVICICIGGFFCFEGCFFQDDSSDRNAALSSLGGQFMGFSRQFLEYHFTRVKFGV